MKDSSIFSSTYHLEPIRIEIGQSDVPAILGMSVYNYRRRSDSL